MKILGIGVDIIENSRIEKSVKNNLFLKRVFSPKELLQIKSIKDKTSFYAKRFAAKEAFSKSIGTGFRKNLNFKDISIVNDKFGKPYFIINKKIEKIRLINSLFFNDLTILEFSTISTPIPNIFMTIYWIFF